MKKVTIIPATQKVLSSSTSFKLPLRVAAYARVSTEHEEQLSSYRAQVDYYTTLIKSHENWVFAGIYSDEGISATNTLHRDGFNQMIFDASNGKIDLILTKSLSRFARNTVDSLCTIRTLSAHNVECYFEKENIWTLDSKGELLLTILSSLAQEESRNISENTKWGIRKKFSDGKYSLAYSHFLGYDQDSSGHLVVNEEEADIVRKIYTLFLQKYSYHQIARELMNQHCPSPTGQKNWYASTIQSILTNEKYCGNALLQKSFTTNYLLKRCKKNNGQLPQYFIKNDHEAIISEAEFQSVQAEIQNRKSALTHYRIPDAPFQFFLRCSQCQCWYGPKVWHAHSKYQKVVYQCNNKYRKKLRPEQRCSSPNFCLEELETLYQIALSQSLPNQIPEYLEIKSKSDIQIHFHDGSSRKLIL